MPPTEAASQSELINWHAMPQFMLVVIEVSVPTSTKRNLNGPMSI